VFRRVVIPRAVYHLNHSHHTTTANTPTSVPFQHLNLQHHFNTITGQTFSFDKVYGPDNTNQQIFSQVIENVVSSAMSGFHGSVFSYGQTNR
jgi:hypothetical protein